MEASTFFLPIFNLSRRSEILDKLMVFGANQVIILTITLVIILFFKGHLKEKKAAALTTLGLIVAFILVWIIRLFYQEPRPFISYPISPLVDKVQALSFPSTHTVTMAVIAFVYTYYRSNFAPLLLFFLFWVGFARIYVGVHYPLDILGGITVGLLSVHLAWIIKNSLKTKF